MEKDTKNDDDESKKKNVSCTKLTELNFSSPLFATEVSRVTTLATGTLGTVGTSAAILPLLPSLLFAKTVGPAVCPSAVPLGMRLGR